MTDKTTAALKLAEEALEELHYSSGTVKAVTLYKSALAAIREVLAQPVKQEPVAWMYDDGTSHKFIEPVLSVKRKDFPDGWRESPLYAAPVSAKAIRAEALEDAVKFLEENGMIAPNGFTADGIRGLK